MTKQKRKNNNRQKQTNTQTNKQNTNKQTHTKTKIRQIVFCYKYVLNMYQTACQNACFSANHCLNCQFLFSVLLTRYRYPKQVKMCAIEKRTIITEKSAITQPQTQITTEKRAITKPEAPLLNLQFCSCETIASHFCNDKNIRS